MAAIAGEIGEGLGHEGRAHAVILGDGPIHTVRRHVDMEGAARSAYHRTRGVQAIPDKDEVAALVEAFESTLTASMESETAQVSE